MNFNNNHLDTSCQLFIYIYFLDQRSWTDQTCVTVVYSSPTPEAKTPLPAPDLDPRLGLPGEVDLPAVPWNQRSPGCVIVSLACVVPTQTHIQTPIPDTRHKKARTKSG